MASLMLAPEEVSSIEIQLCIIEGRDLVAKDRSFFGKPTTSDPYVKVFLGGKCYGHNTPVIKKDLNPKWNATFKILLMDDHQIADIMLHRHPLRLVLWNKNRVFEDCMGVVDLPLDKNTNANNKERETMMEPEWFPVQQGEDEIFDKKQLIQYCHNATGDVKLQYTVKFTTRKEVWG